MATTEIQDALTHCATTIETAVKTTIHLINDTIFTDEEMKAETDTDAVFKA